MKEKGNFEIIRHRITDRLLLVALIVSIPAAITSIIRIFTMGWRILFVIDGLVAVVLLLAFLFRRKIDYRIRMFFLLSYVFIIGVASLNTFGLIGLGLFIFFFITVVATAVFGFRGGMLALGLSFLIFLAYAAAVYFKKVDFNIDFNVLSYSAYHWISRGVFFLCYSAIAVVTLGMIYNHFGKLFQELSISESRLNEALDSVNDVVWELDLKNGSTFVSSRFNEILQFAPDEMALNYESWKKLIHPADLDYVNTSINDHLEGRTGNIQIEYRIRTRTGGWQWMLTRGKIVERNAQGKYLRIVGTHTDIGPRKEMERILSESEQRYRMLFMSANDAILLVENGRILDTNPNSLTLFGMSREELIGQHLYQVCPQFQSDGSNSQERMEEFFHEALKNRSKKTEWEIQRSDGQIIDTLMSISAVYDEGRFLYHVILHDISERKKFEQTKLNAIVETEERERLLLAGDLHDDVGPLLSSLNMYLSLLNRPQTGNRDEIIQNMQGILKEAIRSVREISNNLSPHMLKNYGLVPAIHAFLDMGRKLLEISFEENIGETRLPEVIEINCYRIIKELFNNTLKYASAKTVQLGLKTENGMLFMFYRDDGNGFDLEEKLKNYRTGIGLLNIQNRLNSMKAKYQLESKPGQGFFFEAKIRI